MLAAKARMLSAGLVGAGAAASIVFVVTLRCVPPPESQYVGDASDCSAPLGATCDANQQCCSNSCGSSGTCEDSCGDDPCTIKSCCFGKFCLFSDASGARCVPCNGYDAACTNPGVCCEPYTCTGGHCQ